MALFESEIAAVSEKQPIVILVDCGIDQAVEWAHQSLHPSSITTRILVHEGIHRIFVETLLDALGEAAHTRVVDMEDIPEIIESNLQHARVLAASARDEGAKS